MRISKSWLIAVKDFKIYLKKKYILFSLAAFPLIVSIGLPFVIEKILTASKEAPPEAIVALMNSFLFFFIIGAATLPTVIASYSVVGEKIEKSLEPLLAAPITDSEILLGKTIAAFLPTILVLYLGAAIYIIFVNNIIYRNLGYLYFPNTMMWFILLLLIPLAIILSIEVGIIISSRVNDVRAAQQFGGLIVVPFAAIYVLGEINTFAYTVVNLLIIGAVLIIIDIVLFFISTKTFKREEILTKWR